MFISYRANNAGMSAPLLEALEAIRNRPSMRLCRKYAKFLKVFKSKPDLVTRRAWAYLQPALAQLCELLIRITLHVALVMPLAVLRRPEQQSRTYAIDDGIAPSERRRDRQGDVAVKTENERVDRHKVACMD